MTSDPRECYRRLNDAVFEAYAEARLADGLAALDAAPPELDPWSAELAYLRACLEGASGRPDRALAALRGALDAGGWWDPEVLAEEEDLEALRGRVDFLDLVAESSHRWSGAQRMDRSGDLLDRPPGPARGVVVALHGAEETAADALAAWSPALDAGFVLLAVRSSWRTSPRYRTWPRNEHAAAEVADALAAHRDAIAGLPVVAAGFSAGGRVALHWALQQRPAAVAGVVAVAPATSLAELPAPEAGLVLHPAALVVGGDDDLLDDVREVARKLAPAGFDLDVVSGAGHEVPLEAVRSVLAEP